MGGGTPKTAILAPEGLGLSPRGRGNLFPFPYPLLAGRSIPAWAGEPLFPSSGNGNPTVYPRVGGGTGEVLGYDPRFVGLSPRGRGNLRSPERLSQVLRSIPAWAGEPRRRRSCNSRLWVYPRVGGGTCFLTNRRMERIGLSPRGRGNLAYPLDGAMRCRSIPAWAGEPRKTAPSIVPQKVYPRVGGGTGKLQSVIVGKQGLSPRGRGNQWY